MDLPSSINTHQQSIRGSWPDPCVWCASPVVELHFGRLWCQLLGSGPVCHGTGNTSCLRGASPQALTLFWGARLIAWCLRCSSLGKCWRGLRYFSKCQAHLGYGPVPGPTWRRPSAILIRLVGRKKNHSWPDPRDTITCDTTCVVDR